MDGRDYFLSGKGRELRVLAFLESLVTLKGVLYLNKQTHLVQTILQRTRHLIN